MSRHFIILFLVLTGAACRPDYPEALQTAFAGLPAQIDYNLHVKPILSDRCFVCHGPDKEKIKAGLRLDLAESAYGILPEHPGHRAIVPGNLRKSEVFHRLIAEDPELMMPPPDSRLSLTDYEKAVLIRWIEDGAEYKPHWAFVPPNANAAPEVQEQSWPHNEVDRFILNALEQKGWSHNPEADKPTLLRRLSFDLTGLPPSPADIQTFLKDNSPEAYEKAVDRLLASPAYGERMAVDWLDLARYADTHGYTVDRYRDMSPWRDWVIKAFNANMPYDQFVTWQLAGDLLPESPDPVQQREQVLATGFNRNHQQNMEGGIVEEEFRVEYVADRTNTLGTAFLGLTMECARCHDHKYDPITQKEYFQLFGFFNNVREAGQISWDDALPGPTLLLSSPREDSISAQLRERVSKAETELAAISRQEQSAFEQWLQQPPALNKPPGGLRAYFDLEKAPFVNAVNPAEKAALNQMFVNQKPSANFTSAYTGNGIVMDGDAWLDLGNIGKFDRDQPFSFGLRVKLPKDLKDGILFHRGISTELFNYRGFYVSLKDNRLQLLMAHTAPDNAIIEYGPDLPREQWIHLLLTYDGSSQAEGLRIYMNGKEIPTEVDHDNLFKSIVVTGWETIPGIQIGAAWRGLGIKDAAIDEVSFFERELSPLEVLQIADAGAFQKNKPSQTPEWQQYFQNNYSLRYQKGLTQLQSARATYYKAVDTVQEVMVIREMQRPRQAYVLTRGQYDAHGEPVGPGTPGGILAMPENIPANRLGLAEWLLHDDNPLTARVVVNRLWQQVFGKGLVVTTEDFGNQGALPTHPELLDWLALHFRDSGWDVKAFLKMLVMSSTYRQSSVASDEMREHDPQNAYLGRGPSGRLSAEMIRDNALSAAGLLVSKIGGPSVFPYQPEGLWRVNGAAYQQGKGEDLYRRSLYTVWKRTVPHPTQATFDAPSRSGCTVRRQKTATPLQSLVLLNDPTFVEAARVMGQQMIKMPDATAAISSIFEKLTGRSVQPGELTLLLRQFAEEKKTFEQMPAKTKGWLSTGEYPLDKQSPAADLAAYAVVASTILNTDAALVKR